jgi:hypothetical protein
MEIKTAKVKVADQYEIPTELAEKLELGVDMEVTLKGSIVQVKKNDNQDGTVDMTYLFKAAENAINLN